MSTRKGPPKHQNRTAWKANAGVKTNDKELGGKLKPYSAITGVCPRCKEQIEWRRKYGKYKPLTEPAKCIQCSKRAVRQAYHRLCSGCARERDVCAKCCQHSDVIVGRDAEEEEEQQQILEHALKNLRERDKRTLLRAMNKGATKLDVQRGPNVTNVKGDSSKSAERSDSEDDEGSDDFDEQDSDEGSVEDES